MPFLVCGLGASTRNIHMNQGLRAQWGALKRSRPQSKALDSRHDRQKLRQKIVMFLF